MLVSIRGSYGSEWLSNLAVLGEDGSRSAAGSAASGASSSSVDTAPSDDGHPGYTEAAREVREAVDARIRSAHAAGDEVEVLLVGHSRGGAIANLVAASALDDLAAVQDGSAPQSLPSLRAGDRVRAYTFASPGTTTASDAGDARYGSIFNIVNPADIMVSLPPSSWGYERYGRDMELPSVHDTDFGARFDAMGAAFESMMGIPCIYNPDNELSIDAALGDLSGQVGSAEELKTPAGVIALLSACMARIDPVAVLQGHYPSVYIAWMTSLETETAWAGPGSGARWATGARWSRRRHAAPAPSRPRRLPSGSRTTTRRLIMSFPAAGSASKRRCYRSSTVTVSTCAVCGNMSTGHSRVMRYPRCASCSMSRTCVSGLQLT